MKVLALVWVVVLVGAFYVGASGALDWNRTGDAVSRAVLGRVGR